MGENPVNLDDLIIAPLDQVKTKGAFASIGKDDEFGHLAEWFRTVATMTHREKKSKTYVAVYAERIAGYINLSSAQAYIYTQQSKTKYKFQVLLVGKLLVDQTTRSGGIGTRLIDLAVDIGRKLDELTGCTGLIVDANRNERTISFYSKYGFEILEDIPENDTVRMFFPL